MTRTRRSRPLRRHLHLRSIPAILSSAIPTAPAIPALMVAALLALPTVVPAQLAAQDAAPRASAAEVETLALERRGAERDHLWRIAFWGGANLALGLGMVAAGGRDEHPTRFGFGVQTAAWGAINSAIAGWGLFLSEPGAIPTTLSGALAAENGWADLLLVNLGLNVGYMGVGTALWIASGRGLRSGDTVKGHAIAVVIQGAGLFVLDGVAWLAARGRMETLVEMASTAQVGVVPGVVPGAVGVAIGIPIG